jgi:hypothetical protein
MGERMSEGDAHSGAKMIEKPAVMLTAVAAGLVALGLAAADDARAQTAAADRNTDAALSARAQAPSRPRVRPRIRVTPLYPYRVTPTDYPTPYAIEYPGPGAVRQCRSWLAQEFRPSGPVIVPRMSCWWVR